MTPPEGWSASQASLRKSFDADGWFIITRLAIWVSSFWMTSRASPRLAWTFDSTLFARAYSLSSRDFSALCEDRPDVRMNLHYRFSYDSLIRGQFGIQFKKCNVAHHVERLGQSGQNTRRHVLC